MAKATYIKSYAHAERLGIKPFGSLISTVAIPAKRPKADAGYPVKGTVYPQATTG